MAQFLAAFNDQCIHASAMFFAIRHNTLTENHAIMLMPILFFAPWAVFATLAGYLADRYSKRHSLVFWKIAEIGITLITLVGFYLGTHHHVPVGPWIVLSTVFLMGTHSAFFVPAKYGAMPEILQPSLLSKGNGILESTSFLAVILGTVCGGELSDLFKRQEHFIGMILVVLALIGAVASFLIERMPAANPSREFPVNLVKPLLNNLRVMLRSRPLALSALGIAFFTLMVAFMRLTMYKHGLSQNPQWSAHETSLVVATVALGVGLGSPLAGFLSGGKVELGLVPLGAVGMIVSCLIAAFVLASQPWLIACLILIGFFSGFFIVPLYTLMQHRAPKTSKGDLIATSNFLNVTGAITASALFYVLVQTANVVIAKTVPQNDVASGELTQLDYRRGRPAYIEVQESPDKKPFFIGKPPRQRNGYGEGHDEGGSDDGQQHSLAIYVDESLKKGDLIAVSKWESSPHGVVHYEVRPFDNKKPPKAYDQEDVPSLLFIGAGCMTLIILVILCRKLPDFFVRALLWLRSWGRYRLKVVGANNMPSDGPIILVTNCDRVEGCMQVLSATDRSTSFVLLEKGKHDRLPPLLRYLASHTSLAVLQPHKATEACWDRALENAVKVLNRGEMVGLPATDGTGAPEMDEFLRDLQSRKPVPILPVYCKEEDRAHSHAGERHLIKWVRIVIGQPLPPSVSPELIHEEIRRLGSSLDQ